MSEYNPELVDIKNLNDARREIKKIGSDPQSIEIMAPKAVMRIIKIKNVILQDAIIIKQDMLSVGGEVSVPKKTFELHDKTGEILIIGTLKQLSDLIAKLERHYSRLKDIAKELEKVLNDAK